MELNKLINDYALTVQTYLDVSISKFLGTDINRLDYSKRAFFILIEEPVYSIIKHFTKDSYDWKRIYDEAEFLSNYQNIERQARSIDFMMKRNLPIKEVEAKITQLKGLSKDDFYQAYFKIPEVMDIINRLFDNISFMVLGKAYKGNFSF